MARIHNPPDYDESPPPSYDESQSAANNPIFIPNSEQSCNQITTITTEPSSQTHLGLLRPSMLVDGGQASLSNYPATAAVANVTPGSLTGLYPNIVHQQRPLSTSSLSGGYYQAVHIPQQQGYYQYGSMPHRRRYGRNVDTSERRFPIAALFFLFGWLCPPLWVLGACCCSGRRNRYESWWGKANFVMAIMFIVSSIAYSMIALTLGDWMIGLRILSFSTS